MRGLDPAIAELVRRAREDVLAELREAFHVELRRLGVTHFLFSRPDRGPRKRKSASAPAPQARKRRPRARRRRRIVRLPPVATPAASLPPPEPDNPFVP